MKVRFVAVLFLAFVAASSGLASSQSPILDLNRAGLLSWTNSFSNGVCTIEVVTALKNPITALWAPKLNLFSTNSSGQIDIKLQSNAVFIRLLSVDISPNTPQGYTNLLRSYGKIHTIAGNGAGGTDGVNYWKPQYEGGYATNAALSRPHFAMADDFGNIFIVDKDSHSVLKVTRDGLIHTVAGTHAGGFNGDGPAPATSLKLLQPNGLFIRGDNTIYILDSGNGKVRRVDTNGIMTTVFTAPAGIAPNRGLWVSDDEPSIAFCAGTTLMLWNQTNGFVTLNTNFTDLGNLIATKKGNLIVTDRGADKVYKVDATGGKVGDRTTLYGDGHGRPLVDGTSAVTNSLNGVRGVWKFPTGGYLLALHEGDHLVYVDPADIAHIFVFGQTGAHSGDDQWFHSPGAKVSQIRSVSMDNQGNIFVVENDFGYVRKIDFERLTP